MPLTPPFLSRTERTIGMLPPLLATALLILLALPVNAAPPCGELRGGWYGPYDYTDAEDRSHLHVVEMYHFTPQVESLISGRSGYLWQDLDYTLRAFPNHHRALYAFIRYELRERQKSQQEKKPYLPPTSVGEFPVTAACFFDRAIRWQPRDPNVYMLYGLYFQLNGMPLKALEQYRISEKLQPNSADLHYNLGLLYFDARDYPQAKAHAKRAYQLGYPLPGLRKKLAGVGQWP